MWEIEQISNESSLYFFVHFQNIRYDNSNLNPSVKEAALTNTPSDGLNKSCDWCKHTTPLETRSLRGKEYRLGKQEFKNPNHFFIYSNNAADWRNLKSQGLDQIVEHNPIKNNPEKIGEPNNRAHTIIIGNKDDEKLRVLISRSIKWEISPPLTKQEFDLYKKEL